MLLWLSVLEQEEECTCDYISTYCMAAAFQTYPKAEQWWWTKGVFWDWPSWGWKLAWNCKLWSHTITSDRTGKNMILFVLHLEAQWNLSIILLPLCSNIWVLSWSRTTEIGVLKFLGAARASKHHAQQGFISVDLDCSWSEGAAHAGWIQSHVFPKFCHVQKSWLLPPAVSRVQQVPSQPSKLACGNKPFKLHFKWKSVRTVTKWSVE